MKYLSVGLALFGLSALAWAGVTLVRDRDGGSTAPAIRQASAAAESPLGGPIVHGLQLRFAVVNPTETNVPHVFRLSLVNVSDASVELKYRQSSYDSRDVMPYQDVMRNGVRFFSFPEIDPDSPQTGAPPSDETFVDRAHRLLPGELVEVKWESDDERIALPVESPCGYSRLTPRSTGFFLVRAVLDVEIADGGSMTLWSNESSFVVGASVERPKPHVAQVRLSSQDNSTFTMNVGARDGIEIGDVYRSRLIRAGLMYGWELTVTSVDERVAIAVISSADTRSGESFADTPSWPQVVELECPASRASKAALSIKEARAEALRKRELQSRK